MIMYMLRSSFCFPGFLFFPFCCMDMLFFFIKMDTVKFAGSRRRPSSRHFVYLIHDTPMVNILIFSDRNFFFDLEIILICAKLGGSERPRNVFGRNIF
jgi:hypothetical protein